MNGRFFEECHITAAAPTATGTTAISSAAVDMAGWDGAVCIVKLGSPAVDNNLRARQDDASAGSYADLTGSLTGNSASATPLVIDLYRPGKRYVKFQVTRGTTSTIDTFTIIKYRGSAVPATQPTNTVVTALNSPAEGTA